MMKCDVGNDISSMKAISVEEFDGDPSAGLRPLIQLM